MVMKKLTEDEQLRLRNKAKKEIERLEQVIADAETIKLLDALKNKFNVCESAYKIILAAYQKAKGKPIIKEQLKINMQQVPHALYFAGYNFDKDLLNKLFGNELRGTGCKTVKKLRDGITHGISKKNVEEIKRREKEIFEYMDTFLDVIKKFDDKVTE